VKLCSYRDLKVALTLLMLRALSIKRFFRFFSSIISVAKKFPSQYKKPFTIYFHDAKAVK